MLARTRSGALAGALAAFATATAAQNLYPNPDFHDDLGTDGWVVDPGFLQHGDDDASGCPASGILQASAEEIIPLSTAMLGLGPCLAFEEAATAEVRFLYQGFVSSLFDFNSAGAAVYAEATCAGSPLVESIEFFTEFAGWRVFEAALAVPAGGALRVELTSSGDTGGAVSVDEILVTREPPVFLDGFEGGAACRWSLLAP
jgi:hypothetical protein